MTDKEVRRLSKAELIEILYLLSKENDELRAENEQMKNRLYDLAEETLARRRDEAVPPAEVQTAPESERTELDTAEQNDE